MDFQELIRSRRANKDYDPTHQVTPSQREQLVSDAMLAPTSFNIQHWRFVEVLDTAVRRQIRAVAWDQAQVTDASVLYVITADTQAWQKAPERYWQTAPADKQALLVGMLQDFYRDKPALQRDEAIRSGALAAQNMMLSAKAMGLDSCPMIGFDTEAVAELINLPDDHVIVMLLAVGKAQGAPWPRGGQLPLSEVVVKDRF